MQPISRQIRVLLLIFLSLTPILWLLTQTNRLGGTSASLGNIFGLLGLVFLIWQIILGNRFVVRLFSPDFVASTRLHIWLGIHAVLFIFLHPLLIMNRLREPWSFIFLPKYNSTFEIYVSLGRFALLLLVVTWVTSALIRQSLRFRHWQYLHYLNYVVVILALLHSGQIGSFIHSLPFIEFYWQFIVLLAWSVIILRLIRGLGFGIPRYVLISKTVHHSHVTSYTFQARPSIPPTKPGQFYFLKIHRLGESHPFSVTHFDTHTHTLSFTIKTVGPFTQKLTQLTPHDQLWLDGPYGVFTKEAQSDLPKVIFAGGIGITPFLELIRRHANKQTYLFYSSKTRQEHLFHPELKRLLPARYHPVITQEQFKDTTLISGRITARVITSHLPSHLRASANYFICGSESFIHGVLVILSSLNIDPSQIYTEIFNL